MNRSETPNAQTTPIQVRFFESHEAGISDGEPLPTDIIARFTFDPLQTRAIPEATLPLRDLTPLLISLSYAANTGGMSLFISQSNRDLLQLGNFAPTTNSYLGLRLSDDSYLHIHFNREASSACAPGEGSHQF